MAYNYPYGNGQQLNLDWFLNEWKNLLAAWEAEKNGIEGALQAEIDRAEAALADVFAARDAAAQSAANALESKNAAAQSASDASGYLATVRADANTAHNAAQNAAQSESNASESAQTALASKNTAANSERNAAQSEANANSSKNAAAHSAEDASASKDAAAQSAADADASKRAAAQSAEDASGAAASVEASAQQIATNTSNINRLKEIANSNDDFNMLKPNLSAEAITPDFGGLQIDNFHLKGNFTGRSDNTFVITSENASRPEYTPTPKLDDSFFSIPLIANKKYTLAISLTADNNGTDTPIIEALYIAPKSTKTTTRILIGNNALINGEIRTIPITPTETDSYALRVYIRQQTKIDLKIALYPENNIYQRIEAVEAIALSN